jgi:hypothetical protein
MGFDGGYYMTCSKNFGRMLQASCLALIGTLTVVGCGGSETKTPPTDAYIAPSPLDTGPLPPVVAVTVTPASADFGTVVKGSSSSAPTVITVTNRGSATSLSPAATSPFAVLSTTCGTLAVAGTCTISLSFTPIAVGPASGILTVATGVSVTLTGTGNNPGVITLTDKVDLGMVIVNAPATGSVTVTALSAVAGLVCTVSGPDVVADPTKVCPATLAVGASCAVGFNFKATTTGSKSDSVVCTVAGNLMTSTVVAEVVNPSSLAFIAPLSQSVSSPVGTPSATVSFTLVNSGGAPSGIPVVTPTVDTTQFVVDNQCVLALPANSSCKINVQFKPTTVGQKTLTLTVTDASAPLTSAVATVNGTAITAGSMTIAGIGDFGTVAVGATSAPAVVFTVTNPGATDTAPLTIGVTDPQFVVSADGCSGLPLAATKSCTVSLVFKPTVAGPVGAALSASAAGAATATLPIKGVATGAAALTLAPSTLDFGGVVVNGTSGTKTFTVTNSGQNATGALEVVKTDSTSSVGGGSQFSYTTTCSASLLPNTSCSVVVAFAPLQAGAASASITVRSIDLSTTSQAGTLLGLGLAAADLTLDCGTGDFGAGGTVVTTTSATTLTCKVTNNATTASGAITSAVTGDFAIATDNCKTANLQNNNSCTLVVTFKPTVKGTRTGTITVTSTNSGSANQPLTGVGLGIVEIKEYTTGNTLVTAGNYDFGQVTAGVASSVNLTVAVFVRATVGNLAVTQNLGTPADFVAGTAAIAWPGAPGAGTVISCPALTTAIPTFSDTIPFCVVVVNAKPSTKAVKTGSIVATGANGQTDTGTFTATGSGPLTINPSPLTFAAVAVGDTTILTLTVANNGANPVTAAKFTLSGADAAQFVVVTDGVSNQTIIAPNGTLHANEATLLIRFVPASTGAKTATITVSGTYGAGTETATVTLTGTGGTPAQLTATLGTAFADTAINATSTAMTVTVSNAAGSVPTDFVTYSPTGEFTVAPTGIATRGTCGASGSTPVAAGGSCTILVWFQPVVGLGLGKRTGTLTVAASNAGSVVLNLTGNATPQITVSPSTIQDFGNVVLGDTTSGTKTVTVTNHADAQATVAPTLIGNVNGLLPSDANQFRIVSHTCTTALNGSGGTCTVLLQMVPTAAGVANATLRVRDTGTQQLAYVDVTGNGQSPAALSFTTGTAISRDFGQIRLGSPSSAVTYTVTNTGDQTSGHLTFGLYDHGTTTAVHAKTSDFVMTGTTCSPDTGLAGGASCNIVVAYNPTACPVAGCTTIGGVTEPAVDVDLIVKATPGSLATGVAITGTTLPRLTGTATASPTTSSFLVESTTGLSPFTFAALASGTSTATMILTAGNGGLSIASTDTITLTDKLATGSVPIASEFTIGAAGTAANTCVPATGTNTLVASGTCTFNVVWTPGAGAAGKRELTATVTATSVVRGVATLVAVKPTAASLVATPAGGLNFGNVAQGTDSATMVLTVKNAGESVTTANLVPAKGGTHAAEVTVLPGGCQGATLAAGASCTLSMKVHPAAGGAVVSGGATVTVSAGAATTGPIDMLWTGKAVAQITPNPSQLDFGTVAVGAVSASHANTLPVVLTNQANGTITGPLSITVDNTDFAVSAVNPAGLVAGTDCADPTFAAGLDAATSCTVYVTFSPKVLTPAAKSGTVTINSTSTAQAQVVVIGTATSALIVDHATRTYTASVGTLSTHATQVLTYTNNADAPTTGQLIATLTGADFHIVADTCTGTTVAAAGTCAVSVRFDPTTAGAKTGSLVVSGTPGNSATTALTGTATTP